MMMNFDFDVIICFSVGGDDEVELSNVLVEVVSFDVQFFDEEGEEGVEIWGVF